MTARLVHFKGVARSADGWTALCTAHDDRHSSLSIHYRDGRRLLKCHAEALQDCRRSCIKPRPDLLRA
jgi:hypothetical protein